jgi:hypothetical protein
MLFRATAFPLVFLALTACSQQQAATPAQLDQLGLLCQAQMVASTCQAMQSGNSKSAMPASGEVVFVAGVGPVDAQLLAKLYNAGASMCLEVKATCAADWNSKACTPLKKMYAPSLIN